MSKLSKQTLASIAREQRKREAKLGLSREKGLSHQTLGRYRGFKGAKYGAASEGRQLSPGEIFLIESQMRQEGKL